MQSFLTARYRQVHDKIKDGMKDIRAVSLLENFPPSPLVTKVSLVGTKILHFPYSHYFRRSWHIKYWAVGLIVSLPMFYQFQAMTNVGANPEKFEAVRRKLGTQMERNKVGEERNI